MPVSDIGRCNPSPRFSLPGQSVSSCSCKRCVRLTHFAENLCPAKSRWNFLASPTLHLTSTSQVKILAIQFRYLGDAVLLTPALRAIKETFPNCALHALVASEVVPLLEHSPDLQKVWAFPRVRGKSNLSRTW